MSGPSSPISQSDLRRIVPASWIHSSEVAKASRVRKPPKEDVVRIRYSYIAVPLTSWKKLGNPSRVSCWFEGWDLLITGSDERATWLKNYHAYIPLWQAGFRDYIRKGTYLHPQFSVEHKAGLPVLRISNCNHLQFNRHTIEHWKDAHKRLDQ